MVLHVIYDSHGVLACMACTFAFASRWRSQLGWEQLCGKSYNGGSTRCQPGGVERQEATALPGLGEQLSGMSEQTCGLLAAVINVGWKGPWEGHGHLLTLRAQRGLLIIAMSRDMV